MAFKNQGMNYQQYVYDFAVDGGGTGTKVLSSKSGYAPLPTNALVCYVDAWVVTACTSGGSATLSWGNSGDVDGYSGAAVAVASLTANAVFAESRGGALLWDDTNDARLNLHIADATAGSFVCAIATAALTAGKVIFVVSYLQPSNN